MRPDRVAAVLLAAGAGARFGGGKLDAPLDGSPVGARSWAVLEDTAWLASGIVVPQAAPAFANDSRAHLIVNPDAATGMASSLHHAVGFAQERGADALLIALADMPFVSARTIAALIAHHDHIDPAAATAIRYPDGSAGAPALFGRTCFDALLQIDGDKGAGAYLARRPVITLQIDAAELRDIDRPCDLI